MSPDLVAISRFLSLVLRHRPDSIGLSVSAEGWADVELLLAAATRAGKVFNRRQLEDMVEQNPKQRFSFSDDGRSIRANQGHSIAVDLQLEALLPPNRLYHGTALFRLDAIRQQGLLRMLRHHVHLSANADSAREVGARHGQPIVLTVDAARMARDGHGFLRSVNGVWLVDAVPACYLEIIE